MNTTFGRWLRGGSVVLLLLLVDVPSVIAQEVCANATNDWSWGNLAFDMLQTATGAISTAAVNIAPSGGSCTQTVSYVFTGSYKGDGSFALQGAVSIGSPPAGCASQITIYGTIEQPGCDRADITWTNNVNGAGVATWTAHAITPTESSVATHNWVPPPPQVPQNPVNNAATDGVFQETITPASGGGPAYNFAGRTIHETFPNSTGDTCHFLRSAWGSFVPTATDPFVMDVTNNNQYKDNVGTGAVLINYYRYWQRAPCDFTTTQVMTISTASGPVGYTQNAMDINIGTSTITSTRAANVSQSITWGETQSQYATTRNTWQVLRTWLLTHTPPI